MSTTTSTGLIVLMYTDDITLTEVSNKVQYEIEIITDSLSNKTTGTINFTFIEGTRGGVSCDTWIEQNDILIENSQQLGEYCGPGVPASCKINLDHLIEGYITVFVRISQGGYSIQKENYFNIQNGPKYPTYIRNDAKSEWKQVLHIYTRKDKTDTWHEVISLEPK